MKQIDKLKIRWKGVIETVSRFSLVVFLLIAAVLTNMLAIMKREDENYIKLLVAFLLGAAVFAVLQLLFERYFEKKSSRLIFMGATIIFTAVYYLLVRKFNWDVEITIRTIVIAFILLIAFIWVPVIKNKNNFNESFMAVFKGFFIAAFFNGVLFLGVALILGATDRLITPINEDAYLHAANIIFLLLAPLHFLSLIPFYPREKEIDLLSEEEAKRRADNLMKFTVPAKFLESLISYVIIPITAIFTVILLLYIVMNITGDFWKDNLMEPLLVSYSIIVIIVFVLAGTINNAFAKYFRRIFPKVLVPVVLFQTVSSLLKIGELGVTYGRYYVILFGLFATTAGVLFCIIPARKNGILAPILIGLSVISILPPVDAFTISKINQISRLENALIRNDMLKENTITPNATVLENDREIIANSLDYLNMMDYTKDVLWLQSYSESRNFDETFGFSEYEQVDNNYQNLYLSRDTNTPISITGYDYMVRMNVYNQVGDININSFEKEGITYNLHLLTSQADQQILVLQDEKGQEIIRFELEDIFTKFSDTKMQKTLVPTKELTFTNDNEVATITLVAENININEWTDGKDQQADLNVLIKIK